MDSAAVFLSQPIGFTSSCYSSKKESGVSSASILSSGFCDLGHLRYYNSNFGSSSSNLVMSSIMMNGEVEKVIGEKIPKKMMMKKKKQLKLMKGLSRDLSTFSQIGFGLDSDGLLDQVKAKMISEAAELLLEELQKLKANEKELKRKMKEEKARSKASQMRNGFMDCEMSSSSSSSSESSDSECDEIVDMNTLKSAQLQQNDSQQLTEEATSTNPTPTPTPTSIMQTINSIPLETRSLQTTTPVLEETTLQLRSSSNVEMGCSGTGSSCNKNANLVEENLNTPNMSKKIEVCMGGKCKKLGGLALLEEFQSAIGIEGAVSGCKCMGKCKNGPCVKILDGSDGSADFSVAKAPANSVCIGVDLEDVNMIVANFLGENCNQQLGFAAAS